MKNGTVRARTCEDSPMPQGDAPWMPAGYPLRLPEVG